MMNNKIKNEPKPKQIAPKCPSWLEPDAKKEWRRLSKELESMGLLTKATKRADVSTPPSHNEKSS
jgi:phage terminase small subunit